MKKALAALLALLMILAAGFALAEGDPAVGDVIHGFEVTELGTFDLVNADYVLLEHQKTGAKFLYLANDDTNRVFELTFATPAETDMGVSHVFEHATLDGSKKYPSKSLFFNLSYQTYNTYMNASTYNFMTTYPVASLSEAQLLKYADYYTDSCFNPMVMEDESIFREEAWRYNLDTTESPLTIAGTVYSEMLGSYTLDSAAIYNLNKTLFPGSTVGNSHGGLPSEIPNMTWEDITDYHTRYYHPSNSLAVLYGSFDDYGAFLELLDGYYSAYDKKEFVREDKNYTPITSAQEKTFSYGVEEGSDTIKGGTAYYGIVCENATKEEIEALDLLTSLLSSDSSVLMQNLRTALPAATVSIYTQIDSPEPAVLFCATGMDEADAPVFRDTIDASLRQIAKEGFSQEMVDAITSSVNLEIKLIAESSSIGTDLIPSIAYYWALDGGIHGYMDYIASLDKFDDYAQSGAYGDVINKFLIDNPRTALTITLPVAGLKEQEDAALAEKLAAKKADMSALEVAEIVLASMPSDEADDGSAAQYVSQLQAVTVDSLPEETRIYTINDATGDDGVRRLDTVANTDGVGQALMLLNASGLPMEDLHWLKLYTELLGELDTSAHDQADLASLTTRYLYNGVIRVSVLSGADKNTAVPYVRASWIATDEDMPAAYDLVYELLFETKFDDAQAVRDYIASARNTLKQSFNEGSYEIQLYRAFAASDASYALFNYTSFLDYYAFLAEADALLESDPDAALSKLASVQERMHNMTDAVSAYAGSEESIALHRPVADGFLAKLDKEPITPATYDFPAIARREGLVIDSGVKFNLLFANYDELGLDGYSADLDVISALVSDAFLYPMLRDQYGAYSVFHAADERGMYIVSYRDPNIKETYDVYSQLPACIADLALDQETLDGYILYSYSYYASSEGELTGALNALMDHLDGLKQERKLDWMKAIKAVKADDLARYAEVYQALLDNGVRSTSGSRWAINGASDLFDTVLNP